MKILLGALFFLFFTGLTKAQSYNGKGDSKIQVGYNIYGYGNGIKATYTYGISQQFSLGAGATYYFNNDVNDYFLYGRACFHLGPLLDLPTELDIYPALEFGYLSSNNIGIAGFIGVRYFFTDKIGVYTELGSSASLGLSVCI